MKKATKAWLLVAGAAVLLGMIIFGGAMAMTNWDFTKLSAAGYETNIHHITEAFSGISVTTEISHITFAPADDGVCTVVCYDREKVTHTVEVQDGTLVIRVVDSRKWYEHIGIYFGTPKITVYLPQEEYGALTVKSVTGDVEIPAGFLFESIAVTATTGDIGNSASVSGFIKIKTNTGDIRLQSVTADTLQLTVLTGGITVSDVTCRGDVKADVSTGKTKLTNVTCKNLLSGGSTGDIRLQNVVAAEKFSVKRSTGDIKLERCDALELYMETDTGDIKGSLLTEKVFAAHSDTGKVDVPKTVAGGKCEITTDTGNIKMSVG